MFGYMPVYLPGGLTRPFFSRVGSHIFAFPVLYFFREHQPSCWGRNWVAGLLNQQKYPPSQLFLLMTLGPVIAFVPYAEKARGWFAEVLSTFGKVPFFYYVLHILVIHLAALSVNLIRTGSTHQDWYQTAPYIRIAEEQQWPLPLLYIVFILVEIFLYWACSWYAAYKAGHPEKKWLKYL